MQDDWVIIGQHMTDGDGVMLFVSDTVRGAVRLREAISLRGGEDITVTAHLDDYMKIKADSYEAALRLLFQKWQPPGMTEIESDHG